MELLVHWRFRHATGPVRVMFLDECHLLWGNICGYGWSRRNQRVDIEVKSTKQRQTYYGALDYLTKNFVVQEYSAGNEDNTIAFLEYLQTCYGSSTRLIIIWDGASYHRSGKVQQFLSQVNGDLPQDQGRSPVFDWLPMHPNKIPSKISGCKPSNLSASMQGYATNLGR